MNISADQLMWILLGLVLFVIALVVAFSARTSKAKQEMPEGGGDERSRKEAGTISATRTHKQ